SASSQRRLGTWDRFIIPLPFTRGILLWGEPILVARDADENQARRAIEEAMNAQADRADRMMGVEPVSPA
ncbi:MAG TPA: hypothetical protein VK196_12275, partial [Magnetospirillum sp.]|nr:hypothetical protein [Magnetospirillum sp.]